MAGTFLTSKTVAEALSLTTDVLYIEQVGRTPGSRKISVQDLLKPSTDAIAAEVARATGAEGTLTTDLSTLAGRVTAAEGVLDNIDPSDNTGTYALAQVLAAATTYQPANLFFKARHLITRSGGGSALRMELDIQWASRDSVVGAVVLNNVSQNIGTALWDLLDDLFGVSRTAWPCPHVRGTYALDTGTTAGVNGAALLIWNATNPYILLTGAPNTSTQWLRGRITFTIPMDTGTP